MPKGSSGRMHRGGSLGSSHVRVDGLGLVNQATGNKRPPSGEDRTRNRLRWAGRACSDPGRTTQKELGKPPPYPRKTECPSAPLLPLTGTGWGGGMAHPWGSRLFTKNTGLGKHTSVDVSGLRPVRCRQVKGFPRELRSPGQRRL